MGSLDVPIVAKQLRRLFGQCRAVAEQDVPAATDIHVDSDEGDPSYGALAANREAKKARKDSPRKSRSGSGGGREQSEG